MASSDDCPPPSLRVEVLGPLRLLVGGRPVEVRGERRAAVLARLAMAGGRVVPFEALIDAVWSEDPPSGARQALHSLLSRLRRQLGERADRLERQGDGYRLQLGPGELDLDDVRALAGEARAVASRVPRRSVELIGQALGVWRGAGLAGLAHVEALRGHAVAIEELRLALEEERLVAEMAAGGADTRLVERAAMTAAAEPTRERRQLLYMEALARAGRAADALRTGNGYRRRLGEETGLDPGPALADLEGRIAAGELAPRVEARTDAPPVDSKRATDDVPLRSMEALPPRFRTPLLGRRRELAKLRQLVDDQHLVAVVGPPGVGKTRLAAAVAAELADDDHRSVAFISLATVDATTSLASTVAGALGIRVGPAHTPLAAVVERLGLGDQVLVLDGCEHVLGGVRDLLAELLAKCGGLTVLVTSRVPTGLSGECVVRVPPLQRDGVRLFVERATRVRPGFTMAPDDEAAIAEIVRRLDGLPLAIELAAGRVSTLSLHDLAARLDGALDLLGAPGATGATLRSTLDWSYRLLDDRQQLLLRRLAEFADGVDLSGVELVARDAGLPMGGMVELGALVDASIVDAQLDDPPRYRMLETVRALARDRQHQWSGEADAARAVMVQWAREVAADVDNRCRTPEEPIADRRLRRELANLRSAHQVALQGGDLDSAVAMSLSLDFACGVRDVPEVWSWAQRLVDWPDVEHHPRLVELLGAAGEAAWLQGDLAGAEAHAERGIALGGKTARCLHVLAAVRLFRGHPEDAVDLWLDAFRDEPIYLASAGLAAVYARQPDVAVGLLRDAEAVARDGGAPSDMAWIRYVEGEMGGDDAIGCYEAAIDLAGRAGATFTAGVATVGLACRLATIGADDVALATYDRVIRYWLSTGNWTQQWTTLRNLAVLLERRGDEETAALIVSSAAGAADAAAVMGGSPRPRPGSTRLHRSEVVTRALDAIVRERARR